MKNATVKDVAALAGVSIATVSRYINNTSYVSEEIAQRISNAIKTLDYVPNSVAISLKKTKTKTIGIVIPELSNVSFMDTVQGISDVAIQNGYQPIILSNNDNNKNESKALDFLLSKRVDGLIIATAGGNEEKILRTNKSKIPVVLLDRDTINKDKDIVIDSVVLDNFSGSYKMINYLISLGHKKIAIFAGTQHSVISNERLEGYIKALQHNNIEVNNDYILFGHFGFESGYELAREIVMSPLRPTAIYTVNNILALGVISALNEMNISIPKGMSVCAFGDFKYAGVLNPTLTVINQRAYDIGETAAKLLMDKIHKYDTWKPQKIVIKTEIIIRNSCSNP